MKSFYFWTVCFLGLSTLTYATGPTKVDCLEREKALTLLETADNLLTKAKDSFPNCEEELNATDECGKKKPLAYIEISKKLISDVRENFPTCPEGIPKSDTSRDCSEVLSSGHKESGVYTIWPRESLTTGKSLEVYCDMETDGGGWTVIQRRGKFRVQQDFQKDWESYKNGFGNISEEFWLGNENIRRLCPKGCEIRFDLQDEKGERGFASYQNFNLTGSNYHIGISGYRGNVQDSMQFANDKDFSTKDKGNIEKVKMYKGGWWYGYSGYFCNFNGIYQPGKSNDETVGWYGWRQKANLASVEIKIRAK